MAGGIDEYGFGFYAANHPEAPWEMTQGHVGARYIYEMEVEEISLQENYLNMFKSVPKHHIESFVTNTKKHANLSCIPDETQESLWKHIRRLEECPDGIDGQSFYAGFIKSCPLSREDTTDLLFKSGIHGYIADSYVVFYSPDIVPPFKLHDAFGIPIDTARDALSIIQNPPKLKEENSSDFFKSEEANYAYHELCRYGDQSLIDKYKNFIEITKKSTSNSGYFLRDMTGHAIKRAFMFCPSDNKQLDESYSGSTVLNLRKSLNRESGYTNEMHQALCSFLDAFEQHPLIQIYKTNEVRHQELQKIESWKESIKTFHNKKRPWVLSQRRF